MKFTNNLLVCQVYQGSSFQRNITTESDVNDEQLPLVIKKMVVESTFQA